MSLFKTHRGFHAFINCVSDVSDKFNIKEIQDIMKQDIINGSINYYVAIILNIKNNNIKMLRQLNKKYKLVLNRKLQLQHLLIFQMKDKLLFRKHIINH